MPIRMLQILKFVDFTKKKKSRYLENEKSFFLQIKKIINCTSNAHQGLPYGKNVFVVEVIFNNK